MSHNHTHKSIRNLSIGRHYAPDLVRFVETNAKRRTAAELDSRQRLAIEKFWDDHSYPIYSTSNRKKYPEGDVIKAYFEFFDVMFFGGALFSVTRAKISPKPEHVGKQVWAVSEVEVVTDKDGDKILTHAEIKVFIPDEDHFETRRGRILRK